MVRESFMKGKTVVVTGGTSGIGEVAAVKLAEMGARIVLVARDSSRGEETLARLREIAPGLAHTVHYAGLTRISEMKRVAAEVAEAEPRIDVLSFWRSRRRRAPKRSFISRLRPRSPRRRADISTSAARLRRRGRRRTAGQRYPSGSAARRWRA
jgi:short chain dehydrogenase